MWDCKEYGRRKRHRRTLQRDKTETMMLQRYGVRWSDLFGNSFYSKKKKVIIEDTYCCSLSWQNQHSILIHQHWKQYYYKTLHMLYNCWNKNRKIQMWTWWFLFLFQKRNTIKNNQCFKQHLLKSMSVTAPTFQWETSPWKTFAL